MVDHENLVTFSCFRTFLIFIQYYIFNFFIYFKCFFLYLYIYLYHSCRSNSHGLKLIFPGNFLSGIVYLPVISPPAVYISLLFSLTTAAAVSSYYIMTKW